MTFGSILSHNPMITYTTRHSPRNNASANTVTVRIIVSKIENDFQWIAIRR